MAGRPRVRARTRAAALLLVAAAGAASLAQAPNEAPPVPAKAAVCFACHGPQGRSENPANPILAGQTARYLYLQLRDFQEGRREEPQMAPIVQGLTRDEMRDLAAYFAAQKPPPQPFAVDPVRARRGAAKAAETLCTMCHLGGFGGQNEIPRVAGQHQDYIVKQLADFKARRRTNDAGNMTAVSRTLSDEDIEDLAHYLTGL